VKQLGALIVAHFHGLQAGNFFAGLFWVVPTGRLQGVLFCKKVSEIPLPGNKPLSALPVGFYGKVGVDY